MTKSGLHTERVWPGWSPQPEAFRKETDALVKLRNHCDSAHPGGEMQPQHCWACNELWAQVEEQAKGAE